MFKPIIFTCLLFLFLLNISQAQYINTDSLVTVEGYVHPVLVAELDSLEEYLPELSPEYFSQGLITSGYLLSQFSIPAKGKVISHFGPRSGRMHTGTDLKMQKGDTICASFDGNVVMAKYYHGYGNMVVLDHGHNLETYYAHLSKCLVNTDMWVKRGEPVGLAGSSGRATTSHLHFEIRENKKPYNAELVFDFENGRTKQEIADTKNLAHLNKKVTSTKDTSGKPTSQKYVVRPGDSLYKISRRVKTSIGNLCMLNNLTEQSVLQIGQVLNVF